MIRWRVRGRLGDSRPDDLVGPIHGELLGAEHLAARARELAAEQHFASRSIPNHRAHLLHRLAENRRILAESRARLIAATERGIDAGPAAEWLLDNFHVVQDELQEVRSSLPRGYYRELPELIAGPLAGYPRVYEIAISLISHSEARIDIDNVELFVASFQSVRPLSVGELWALPAMLRLGLLESVRRMTLRTGQRLDDRALAELWSERILTARAQGGPLLRATLKDLVDSKPELTAHFVARFLQLLRQAEGVSTALAWIENWLRDSGVSPDDAMAKSTQRLALTRVIMANSVTSLRQLGRLDWRMFVERQSEMEAVLRKDPSGSYPLMTFATRDRYRHVVEHISRRTGKGEAQVAQFAIDLANQRSSGGTTEENGPDEHVGYYLIDDGLVELEMVTGFRPRIGERIIRAIRNNPNAVFIGGLFLCTTLATLAVLLLGETNARASLWLVLLVAFLPALDVAVNVLNQLVTIWLPPRILPRLDFHERGVPAECRTAVVIPTLFRNVDDVRDALTNLEVQFLANRGAHLHFAILSDFTDGAQEVQPGDEAIVATALEGIRALNERYAPGGPEEFHLLHRPRRWNAQQGVWMGWERKRGKLAEFNQLLRGNATHSFSVISGSSKVLRDVRYVITLDADTLLPPDAAPALVGAMAHPLNRAVYDPTRGRVVRGYGILQPRVGVSLPSAKSSHFAAIASGHPGVDPYSTAVSDVYQDLYGEGSYTGKGIYDVDAFEMATNGRFPENTLLSHDLIEGTYARAGLATDIIVYDEYPANYVAFARRKHRWIRGDWQLLPWLHRSVPGPNGPEPNRLSLLSRWKIVDNLRRSTVEIAQLLFLVAGWTVLPGSALTWTLLGLGAIVAPWVTSLLLAVVRPPLDKSWRAYYAAVAQDALVCAQQAAVTIVFLPHQAFVSADAIIRTLHRLLISRRLLLQWEASSLVKRATADVAKQSWHEMRTATLIVAAGVVLVWYAALHTRPAVSDESLVVLAISMWSIVLVWLLAPYLAAQLSRAAVPLRRSLSAPMRATALRYAAAHWHFFERFVGDETLWLAPDNFQSNPEPVVAMRTSPTNIGLQLLATVSARDLGFITAEEMTERLERAFTSIARLRRYKGHFYNWYDLRDLSVLSPPYISSVDSGNLAAHLIALRQACLQIGAEETSLRERLHTVADAAYDYANAMDFRFLYDASRKLLTVGYHPDSYTPDSSFYDLLASEARQSSFVAISKNDLPVEHWFRLSRTLTRAAGSTALVSWSGSMFEYLMPLLVMKSLPFTILAQTYDSVLRRQIAYAQARGVPWGFSESAYNVRDSHGTYQYRAFGNPDLGLKRGLDRDLTVAPYASALAALIDPPRALANLQLLESLGALDEIGFCDAIDFKRPDPGSRFALVHTRMAHHIGMTMVALTNVLLENIWQERFHQDSLVKAAELLLHERVPRRLVMHEAQEARPTDVRSDAEDNRPVVREVAATATDRPRVALLGTPPYTVMLNHSGGGYSRYDSLAVTRWRADSTLDDSGQFCYVKDVATGRVWSSAHQPVCAPADWNRAWLAPDRVTLRRRDGDIETRTDITVVPADAAEVRRVTIINRGRTVREFELTSYAEVVLGSVDADRVHPAFSNLFVETEWHAWCSALTATRRPRSDDEQRLWCVHVMDSGSDRVGDVSWETDRSRFVGRGRTVRDPAAMDIDGSLTGTAGATLDPILALRTRVRISPGQSASVAFTTLVATSRKLAFALADRYHEAHAAQRALDLSGAATQISLRDLGMSPTSAAVFQDIATQLLYGGGSLAPASDELMRNRGTQARLWAHGIPGDRPILLATIAAAEGLPTLRELFAAHRYWRRRGLPVDLVVINTHPHDYLQELRDGIGETMVATTDAALIDQPGGVFVRKRDAFQPEDYLALSAASRVQVECDGRTLGRILSNADARAADAATLDLVSQDALSKERTAQSRTPAAELGAKLASIVSVLRPLVGAEPSERTTSQAEFMKSPPPSLYNGIGGVDSNGDYRIVVNDGQLPPAPWCNIIANPFGGFLVSERGSGCTWAENAFFYRLTPWHNDPVCDPISEVLFLQNSATGELWTPTPAPGGGGEYRVRHSAGASAFEHNHDGIVSELQLGMADDAAVKVSLLKLTNASDRQQRLVLTAYVEWTLGTHRDEARYRVRTRFGKQENAIFAQNNFDPLFAEWTAFLSMSDPVTSFSANRETFIGRNGSISQPAALADSDDGGMLDSVTGVGIDPCGALQTEFSLAPGETRVITILLGAASSDAQARATLARFRAAGKGADALALSVEKWRSRLGVVTVRTPDPAFDWILNKWSLYQALSCRMWGRMGLYQSSGAYGFRDQLQDVMAFLYAEPAVARAHILRAASRQFVEGDVQHWWHPQSGRGVRTRFSDDLVWLPYVVNQYVRVTGDATVLDEVVPYLRMRTLGPDERELYDLPAVAEESSTVFEHCMRALRVACTSGAHGLPLIGTGDWNDGFSRVGVAGQGESVWLGWFLSAVLRSFAKLCDERGDSSSSLDLARKATEYLGAVEKSGWDGEWYRRAYYDDGTPLGSSASDECRIDSIAQSWSVISEGGNKERSSIAMHSLEEHLVRNEERLILLLTPPFDQGKRDPGYIKGYVPGVRENGAQYTHAALWAVLATAMQGDGDRAFELFQMCNPLTRGSSPADMQRYKVEPYVVAADVYSAESQLGRGGWTWYTGSASWLYRIGLENLLGFTKVGDTLRINPCVPRSWSEYEIVYQFGAATWNISVRNPAAIRDGAARVIVDGEFVADGTIRLVDDGKSHRVIVGAGVRTG